METNELANEVIEAMLDAVVVTDLDGTICRVNAEFERGSGWKREEAVGRTVFELGIMPKEEARRIEVEIKPKLMKQGRVRNIETTAIRRDGTDFPASMSWTMMKDAEGKATGIITVARDITELKKTEAELRRLEQKWHSLVQNAPDIVMVVDRDGRIEFINHTVPGISPDEPIGRTVYDYIPREHQHKMAKSLERAFEDGKTSTYEAAATGPHGALSWYETRIGPITQGHQVVSAGIIATDITERKNTEQQLRVRDNAIAASIAAIALSDPDGNLTYVNPSFLRLWGYDSQDEVLGRHVVSFWWAEDEVTEVVDAVRGKGRWTGELVGKRKDGSLFHVHLSASSVTDERGELVGMMGSFIDITEHKRAQEALRQSEEEYRILVENQTDMIVKFDTDGVLLFVSPSYCKAFGKRRDQLIGSRFMPLIHEEDREKVAEALNSVYQPPYTGYVEERALTKDGWRWQAWLNTAVLNSERRVETIIAVGRDITERTKVENQLKDSEQRYRTLVNNIPGMVYRAGPDWFTQIVSDSKAICGYSARQLNAKKIRWLNIIHPEDKKKVVSDAFELEEKPSSTVQQYRIIDKRGKIRWVEDHKTSRFTKDGVFDGVDGIVFDVTKRKEAEQALAESEHTYRDLVNNISDGVYRLDRKGKFTYINRVIERRSGTPARKFSDLKFVDVLLPKYREIAKRNLERVLQGKRVRPFEVAYETARGDKMILETNPRPIRDQGRIIGLQGISRDITERKKAEQKLEESERTLKSMLNSITESALLIDKDGTIVAVNETTAERLGFSVGELIGKCGYDFVPKDVAKSRKAWANQVIRTGKPVEFEDVRLGRNIHNSVYPVCDSRGRVARLAVFGFDITEAKRREQQLNEYREKIAQAEQLASVGTLSAELVHRLAQPFTVIGLNTENSLARLQKLPSCPRTVKQMLREALTGLSNATSTVELFRDFARKSEGKMSAVDLQTIADRIIMLLGRRASRAKLALRLSGLDGLPPVYGNEQELEQLFFALVDNAIHAADGKKDHRLTISGTKKGKAVELRFSDDCSGISPKNLNRIFEPFFTTKPPGEGTGLGLCIVQRVAEETGGNVRVESRRDKGSTFFVTLPVGRSKRS